MTWTWTWMRYLLALTILPIAGSCAHHEPAKPARAVSVAEPAPPPPARARDPEPEPPSPPPAKVSDDEGEAVFFDFDSSVLRPESAPVLQKLASEVRMHDASLRIEGNCDDTGTTEYNLALGEHRARSAKDYLIRLGVPTRKISTVSYGSQRQRYPGHDELDRAKNRRDDFVVR